MKPADCEDLSLTGIALVSQQENAFDTCDSTPVVRTPSSVASISGDATLFDRLRILLDSYAGVGVHAIDGNLDATLGNYVTGPYVPSCVACATYQEDLDASAGTYAKLFATKSGEVEITDRLTPHETAGVARYLELREAVVPDPNTSVGQWVPGGKCYWIEEATFDVRRPKGCQPFVAGQCPSDQFCLPTNSIGTDGECVTGGTKAVGESCTRPTDGAWDSDCALGSLCLYDDPMGSAGTCYQVCDVFSDTPGCPAGTHCGGGYDLCMPEDTLTNSGLDSAAIGEECKENPYALYCGGDGRPGTCWDQDFDGPQPSMCWPLVASQTECTDPTQTISTIAYKNYDDQSTHWCVNLYPTQ